jgi:Arc/MetJ-type ribon-helix-helix transcriptional regulator
MNIELPADMIATVKDLVASGKYKTEQEAIVEGVRMMIALEKLRAELQRASDQIDRGEWVDGEEALDELDAEIDAMIVKQHLEQVHGE